MCCSPIADGSILGASIYSPFACSLDYEFTDYKSINQWNKVMQAWAQNNDTVLSSFDIELQVQI